MIDLEILKLIILDQPLGGSAPPGDTTGVLWDGTTDTLYWDGTTDDVQWD